jgi:hypothetical protein
VNAIPFNADPNLPAWMKRPDEAAIDRFVDALVRAGARVTVRRSKGREIAAACGQLRGKSVATSARARRKAGEAPAATLRQRELTNRRVDRSGRVQATRVQRDRVDDERR